MSNDRYIVTVKDRTKFFENVVGGVSIVLNYPELVDGDGVSICRDAGDGNYWILDEGVNNLTSNFFTYDELEYLEFGDDVMFSSNARWPVGTYAFGSDRTSVGEQSARMARVVCEMLASDGWGGEGKIFPLEVWVEPEGFENG